MTSPVEHSNICRSVVCNGECRQREPVRLLSQMDEINIYRGRQLLRRAFISSGQGYAWETGPEGPVEVTSFEIVRHPGREQVDRLRGETRGRMYCRCCCDNECECQGDDIGEDLMA